MQGAHLCCWLSGGGAAAIASGWRSDAAEPSACQESGETQCQHDVKRDTSATAVRSASLFGGLHRWLMCGKAVLWVGERVEELNERVHAGHLAQFKQTAQNRSARNPACLDLICVLLVMSCAKQHHHIPPPTHQHYTTQHTPTHSAPDLRELSAVSRRALNQGKQRNSTGRDCFSLQTSLFLLLAEALSMHSTVLSVCASAASQWRLLCVHSTELVPLCCDTHSKLAHSKHLLTHVLLTVLWDRALAAPNFGVRCVVCLCVYAGARARSHHNAPPATSGSRSSSRQPAP